jgi:hypothetical protein
MAIFNSYLCLPEGSIKAFFEDGIFPFTSFGTRVPLVEPSVPVHVPSRRHNKNRFCHWQMLLRKVMIMRLGIQPMKILNETHPS